MSFVVTSWTAALCGILLVALSLHVSLKRFAMNVVSGDGGDEVLRRRVRAQGNFTEYVPTALILLLLCEARGSGFALLVAIGASLVLGRALHAIGMLTGLLPPRAAGMLLTYASIVIGALTLMVSSFG